MAKKFDYTVVFKGNVDDIKNKLYKSVGKYIKDIQENAIKFVFDYDNILDLQSQLDKISEQLDPTIGVQFKYEVNKKLLENAKEDLEKAQNSVLPDKGEQYRLKGIIDELTSSMKELENQGAKTDYLDYIVNGARNAEYELNNLRSELSGIIDYSGEGQVSDDIISALKNKIYEYENQIGDLKENIEILQDENDYYNSRGSGSGGDYYYSYYSDYIEALDKVKELEQEIIELQSKEYGIKSGSFLGINERLLQEIAIQIKNISDAIGKVTDDNTLLSFLDKLNLSLNEVYTTLGKIEIKESTITMNVDMGNNKNPKVEQFLRQNIQKYTNAYKSIINSQTGITSDDLFSMLISDKDIGKLYNNNLNELKEKYDFSKITSLQDMTEQARRFIELFNYINMALNNKKNGNFREKLNKYAKDNGLSNEQIKQISDTNFEYKKDLYNSENNGVPIDLKKYKDFLNILEQIEKTKITISDDSYWEALDKANNSFRINRNITSFNNQLKKLENEALTEIKNEILESNELSPDFKEKLKSEQVDSTDLEETSDEMSDVNETIVEAKDGTEKILLYLEDIDNILKTITSENSISKMIDEVIEKVKLLKSTINDTFNFPLTTNNGEELVVYRGVNDTSVGFQTNKENNQTYWTTNIDQANEYAKNGGKIFSSKVKVNKAKEIDAFGQSSKDMVYLGDQQDELSQEITELYKIINTVDEEILISKEELAKIDENSLLMLPRRLELERKINELEEKKNRFYEISADENNPYGIHTGTESISEYWINQGYDTVIFKNVKTVIEDTIDGIDKIIDSYLGTTVITTNSKQLYDLNYQKELSNNLINISTGNQVKGSTLNVLKRLSLNKPVSNDELLNLYEVIEADEKASEELRKFINKYSKLKSRKDVINESEKTGETIDEVIERKGTSLIRTKERNELRNSIIKQQEESGSFSGYRILDGNKKEIYEGNVDKDKRVDIVIGYPASGKSSSLVSPLSELYKSKVIDSDIVKEALPEFNNGIGASLVHEESKEINKKILSNAIKKGENIVLPIIGDSIESITKYLKQFSDAGYNINIHNNEVPQNIATNRNLMRYFTSGRYINPSMILGRDNPTNVYNQLITDKDKLKINSLTSWDNNIKQGGRPLLINKVGNESELLKLVDYLNNWGKAKPEDKLKEQTIETSNSLAKEGNEAENASKKIDELTDSKIDNTNKNNVLSDSAIETSSSIKTEGNEAKSSSEKIDKLSDSLNENINNTSKDFKNDLILSQISKESEEWEEATKAAENYGIKIDEIAKIERHVTRLGEKDKVSYNITDINGNTNRIFPDSGISYETQIIEISKLYDNLEKVEKKIFDLKSKLLSGNFDDNTNYEINNLLNEQANIENKINVIKENGIVLTQKESELVSNRIHYSEVLNKKEEELLSLILNIEDNGESNNQIERDNEALKEQIEIIQKRNEENLAYEKQRKEYLKEGKKQEKENKLNNKNKKSFESDRKYIKKILDKDKYLSSIKDEAKQILELIDKINSNEIDVDVVEKKFNEFKDKITANPSNYTKGNEYALNHFSVEANKLLSKNTAMSDELHNKLQILIDDIKRMTEEGEYSASQVSDIKNRLGVLENELESSGQTGKKFMDVISERLTGINAQFIAQYFSIQDWIRYIRSAIQAVIELDTALTELKIVSGESDSQLKKITESSYKLANRLGSTTTEVLNSITSWRRLGKSVEDSQTLAEQSAILSTGGFMSVETSTTALTSSLQAFNMSVKDSSKLVDQFIYLGKVIALR